MCHRVQASVTTDSVLAEAAWKEGSVNTLCKSVSSHAVRLETCPVPHPRDTFSFVVDGVVC